ncbi:MAG: hypothetical protein COY40_01190 [Alphaproteobacteria bacterium CG_4_10_14_0_8_um_filter_53_9]|nr:MAG: hypothetical protein COY40_01190 [Alphaproteobacteria bacterium CG_4_10_14_0_8_um_filter_53_9]
MWFLGSKEKAGKKPENVSLEVIDPREADGHCLITGNLQIRGDVYFSGQLRVDGRIDGKVSVYEGGRGQLILSKTAVINGPVNVTSALIDGTVNGPMDVMEKMECRTNAIIRGRVLYGSMHITDGAKIEAQCKQRDGQAGKQDAGSSTPGPLLATRSLASKSGS